jgi:hypothetical protein
MRRLETNNQFQIGKLLSWLATGIVALFCVMTGLYLVRAIPIFATMFQGLGVELPLSTRLLLATYYWVLPVLFVALAVFVVWKEISLRELRYRIIVTITVFLAALGAPGLVMLVLYQPLFTLIKKLGEAK